MVNNTKLRRSKNIQNLNEKQITFLFYGSITFKIFKNNQHFAHAYIARIK